MTQPEALRLADLLEQIDGQHWQVQDSAAAELRRLHEKCEALTADVIQEMRRINQIHELTAQRDALLEALRKHVYLHDKDCVCEDCAAIAKAEENT